MAEAGGAPSRGWRLQEQIQILHREGLANKMGDVFELEVHAPYLAKSVLDQVGRRIS